MKTPPVEYLRRARRLLDTIRHADFLAPLLLRAYLVPVFWVAGMNKWGTLPDTIAWFGDPDWGLGLPFPTLLAYLATLSELGGAVLLGLGLGVRLIAVPLMVTMGVAALKVHWTHGWQAVADPLSPFPPEHIAGAMQRLEQAREILREYGDYDWLTQTGSFVISNNGIEWAATYFLMLLVLFFIGGGRYVSADFWIGRVLAGTGSNHVHTRA